MTEENQLHWHDPNWQKQAHDWIREETRKRSIQITGEIEQPHIVHWSTVMRIPTHDGILYFKAAAGEMTHEIALTQKLASWFPEDVPDLIAIDSSRGWMLMRDGGATLRTSVRPAKTIQPWKPVIAQYARLQIGLTEHVDDMLSLGVPDHRLVKLPALFDHLLADVQILRVDQEQGITSDELQQLRKIKPRFEQICRDLATYGIPESINHGDFHDGNVLIKENRITFFDWGDADITHPFVSLRTLWVSIEISLELDDYAFTPEMTELLDLYLEPFEKYASKDDLHKAYLLSKPVASVVKALAWYHSIMRMDVSIRADYIHIVPAVLQEFLYHMNLIAG